MNPRLLTSTQRQKLKNVMGPDITQDRLWRKFRNSDPASWDIVLAKASPNDCVYKIYWRTQPDGVVYKAESYNALQAYQIQRFRERADWEAYVCRQYPASSGSIHCRGADIFNESFKLVPGKPQLLDFVKYVAEQSCLNIPAWLETGTSGAKTGATVDESPFPNASSMNRSTALARR